MYKSLVQDSEDGAMTFFCNIQDHIKNNFQSIHLLPYLPK